MKSENIKEIVGKTVIDELVTSGMKIGMGSGSTVIMAIKRLGELYKQGAVKDIVIVSTSFSTDLECQKWGLPLCSLNDPIVDGTLDIAIDGADEVDPGFNLVKGGGAALLPEKIVAYSSKKFVVIVDESKMVDSIGTGFRIPVEVIPSARVSVSNVIKKLGGDPQLRMAEKKLGPVITDSGNLILDVLFPQAIEPGHFEIEFNCIPGVVENGLFTRGVSDVFVGYQAGNVERLGAK